MLVEELIEHLKTFPKDSIAVCVYRAFSDYFILEPEDITYYDKEQEKEIRGPFGPTRRYVLRHGKVMEYDEKTWDKSEIPNFVSIVAFPGN